MMKRVLGLAILALAFVFGLATVSLADQASGQAGHEKGVKSNQDKGKKKPGGPQ